MGLKCDVRNMLKYAKNLAMSEISAVAYRRELTCLTGRRLFQRGLQ